MILLSRLPFINLYYEVLALIAPRYFAGGESVLHNACLDISNWPSLQAGECIQLSLLGTLFQTYIPSLTSANLQQPYSSTPSAAHHQIEDLKNNASSPETPTISNENANENANANTNDLAKLPKKNSSEDCDDQSTDNAKNANNITQQAIDDMRASLGSDIVRSREDILDSYKQSKEMLLAQQSKQPADSPCDSNSSKSYGANNANDNANANANDDEADVDLDEYFNVNYSDKFNESDNTQSETRANIERTLRLAQLSVSKTPIVLSSVTEIDIFRSFYTVISYTHLLWELVLTAEPIVVMATSPSDCSHMVQSLMG